MTKTITIRVNEAVLEAIDARAKDVGISRNEWYRLSSEWVLQYLPTDKALQSRARDEVAHNAPRKVTGDKRVQFGKKAF